MAGTNVMYKQMNNAYCMLKDVIYKMLPLRIRAALQVVARGRRYAASMEIVALTEDIHHQMLN